MPSWLRWRMRRFGFHVLRQIARLSGRLGPRTLGSAGEWLGRWHFRVDVRKRRRLLRQVARVQGRPADDPAVRNDLRAAYQINDRAILEVMAIEAGAVPVRQMTDAIRVSGIAPVQRVLDLGEGVILLGMHMGNGIAFAMHLAIEGLPVSVVYRESRKMPPGFFRRVFERAGVEAISATPAVNGYRNMVKALKRGRAVFVLMDQASKRGGIPTDFLGKEVPMPSGPAELARRTGVPLFPVLTLAASPCWSFQVGEPIRLCDDGPIDRDVGVLVQVMDSHIRAHPHLWSWHQRRWWRYPFPRTG